jgi:hypothetical protein
MRKEKHSSVIRCCKTGCLTAEVNVTKKKEKITVLRKISRPPKAVGISGI